MMTKCRLKLGIALSAGNLPWPAAQCILPGECRAISGGPRPADIYGAAGERVTPPLPDQADAGPTGRLCPADERQFGGQILGVAIGDRADSAGRHATDEPGAFGKTVRHARPDGMESGDALCRQRSDGGHRAAAQAVCCRPACAGERPRPGCGSAGAVRFRCKVLDAWYDYALTAELIRLEQANLQLLRDDGDGRRGAKPCGRCRTAGRAQSANEVDSANQIAAMQSELPARCAALNALLGRDSDAPMAVPTELPARAAFAYSDGKCSPWRASEPGAGRPIARISPVGRA